MARPLRTRTGEGSSQLTAALFWPVVGLMLLWAGFQQFFKISLAPPLYDEPVYVDMGWRYTHWALQSAVVKDPMNEAANFEHPPLAKYLFGIGELLAGHQSLTAARVVAGICTLLSALVLGVWVSRLAGRWTGVLAGGLLGVVPLTVDPQTTGFGRTAMLDVVAELFAVISVALAWEWFTATSAKASWWWAIACGVAVGLAEASKENAFVGALVPIVVGAILAIRAGRARRALPQLAAALACAVGVFLVSYLPLEAPWAPIRFMFFALGRHSSIGHQVGFAGRLSTDPPWWTNFWFAGHGMGAVPTVAVLCGFLAMLVLRRDLIRTWILAALLGPIVLHCFISDVTLSFYWVMWMPMVMAGAAVGIRELIMTDRTDPRLRLPGRVVAAALVLVMAVTAVRQSITVATLQPTGIAAIAQVRAEHALTGQVAIFGVGVKLPEARFQFGTSDVTDSLPADLQSLDTIAIGQPACGVAIPRQIKALIAVNLAAGALRELHADRILTIYQVTQPIHLPTSARIKAQKFDSPANLC